MKELHTKDIAEVNGGIAPLVLVGYFVGGVVTGGAAAAGAIWVAKQLKAL
jgi:lactobin A/cerein 7B family class IIb bacteriocin